MPSKKQPENKSLPAVETKSPFPVLEKILNRMNLYLYVSDPKTNKILFINDKMRSDFNLAKEEGLGVSCWGVLRSNFKKNRSSNKNTPKKSHPQPEGYEDFNPVTGKYYTNTDSFIEWSDGSEARLHHLADITPIKLAEQTLERRVKQQRFMIEVARVFISGEKVEDQISQVLGMAGNFRKLDAVRFYRYDEGDNAIKLLNIWSSLPDIPKVTEPVYLSEKNILFDALAKKNFATVTEDDVDANAVEFYTAQKLGIKSLMAAPVVVSEKLLGVLFFEAHLEKTEWNEEDKQMGSFIAGLISGVILRRDTEKSLFKMSAIVNNSPQYITATTRSGKYTYVNPAMMKITGYNREDLINIDNPVINQKQQLSADAMELNIKKILENGHYEFENVIDTKYGMHLTMLMSLFFIDEQKSEVACIATDITEQRRLEAELIAAKNIAENANSAKSAFLSRMSHEIRTPITAIMGMTTIARSASDIEKKDYCLDKIENASVQLLGIVNDILDMSKIEANKFELSQSEFNIEKMIEKVVNVVNLRIEQKQQELIINIESNIPKMIIGDEMRLNQVLINLISNASKFTPDNGTIKLSVAKIEHQGTDLFLKFEVEDNGIGITAEQQARLFISFEQADGSISRKFGGTGLGLSISKRIVELMEGTITVESEIDKGSKFIFTIKTSKGQKNSETMLDQKINSENIKVLVVDDSREIRDYFLNLMQKFSIKCDVASEAGEALALIQKNTDNPYNIIFIDWKMPGINGVELTKKIREHKKDNYIIIMISAAQWADIESKALEAGADKFIGKPLFPSVLLNIVNESFSGGAMLNTKSATNNISTGKYPDFEGQNILAAEDTEINRDIIKAFLQTTRVNIDFATNGLEAVDMFKVNPDKYSLILMDVHMPKMDGLEATKAIRTLNIDKAKTIPIIALTANVFLEDIKECLDAGMNSHIGKPIELTSMFETLVNYMPKPAKKDAVLDDNQGEYSKYLPYIDVKDGLERLMNDKKFYFQMLNKFDGMKHSQALINSMKEVDCKTVAVAAHTLKGITANLGLTALWDLSKAVEIQAKLRNDLSEFTDKINEVTLKTMECIKELTKN